MADTCETAAQYPGRLDFSLLAGDSWQYPFVFEDEATGEEMDFSGIVDAEFLVIDSAGASVISKTTADGVDITGSTVTVSLEILDISALDGSYIYSLKLFTSATTGISYVVGEFNVVKLKDSV